MKRFFKILVCLVLALLLALLAGLWAVQRWTGTDDFRLRVERQAGAALGVGVRVQGIQIDLWPVPAVALHGVTLQTQPVLSVEGVELRPQWSALLHRQLVVQTLLVRNAVLPQAAIDALAAARKPATSPADSDGPSLAALMWLPRRTLLEGVSWVSRQGQTTTVDLDLRLDEQAWPGTLTLKVLKGAFSGTRLDLTAGPTTAAQQHLWALKLTTGGGAVEGPVRLTAPATTGGEWQLLGDLRTHDLEVAALTAPARTLSGRLQATSQVSARWSRLTQLPDALQSQTSFTVRDAVVHGIDLARAVRSVGLSRGGETRLDTLTGQLVSHGRAFQLHHLQAKSGLLAANGDVSVSANQGLSGRVNVDVGTQLVGVPLVLGGSLNAPEVTLSRSAMLGAAVGTLVLPGVGTGAGAKLGDKLGDGMQKLFGK